MVLILVSSSVMAGLNINRVSQESFSYFSSVIIDGKVMYTNDDNELWINTGSLNSEFKPQINGNTIHAGKLVKVNDFVVFINRDDGNRIWRTDGQIFNLLTVDSYDYLETSQSGDVVARRQDTGSFITIDNSAVDQFNTQQLLLSTEFSAPVCKFDNQHAIFSARVSEVNDPTLYLYQNGNIIPLVFDESLSIDQKRLELEIKHGDYCYYKYNDYAQLKVHQFKIDASGIVSMLEVPEQGNFNDLKVFNNQLLMLLKPFYGGGNEKIYTLDNDSTTPQELFDVADNQFYYAHSYWVSDDYLYVLVRALCKNDKCTPSFPNPYSLNVYDKSLHLVNTIVDARLTEFSLESADDKNFLLLKGGQVNEILELSQGTIVSRVKDVEVDFLDFIGGIHGDYFVRGINRLSHKGSIYKASNKAVVSKALSGLWVSDQWQSQGLSIQIGKRANDSYYFFVSFYLYRDGEPFWIAGTTDLNAGASEETLTLYEYKGQSFLSNNTDQTNQRIEFGTMSLKPQSCNLMKVDINPLSFDSVSLDMKRLVDTSFENVCVDN